MLLLAVAMGVATVVVNGDVCDGDGDGDGWWLW